MYQIIYPTKISDIKNESKALRHLAHNFVDGMLEGRYAIAFLRRTDAPNTPLLTIMFETNFVGEDFKIGKIIQTGGLDNRRPTAEEQEFLDKWQAKNSGMPVAVGVGG